MPLTPFPPTTPTTIVAILSCRRYTMGLTSEVPVECGGARKRPRSDNGDASGGLSKSLRRDSMDCALAFEVSEVELDGFSIPRGDAIEIDDHSAVDIGALRYAFVDYQTTATQSVPLAREFAPECTLPVGGPDYDNVDITDYILSRWKFVNAPCWRFSV